MNNFAASSNETCMPVMVSHNFNLEERLKHCKSNQKPYTKDKIHEIWGAHALNRHFTSDRIEIRYLKGIKGGGDSSADPLSDYGVMSLFPFS